MIKMKILTKIITKLKEKWMAKTPKFARFFQIISTALAALPLYYASLPLDFQVIIPQNWLKWISICGFISVFLFNFFTEKNKTINNN